MTGSVTMYICGTPVCGTPVCGTPVCGTPVCGTPVCNMNERSVVGEQE